MSITTTTHLNFTGQARAALEFYQSVFGGSLTIASYGDFGMPADAPGAQNVVFGQVESEGGFRVMAYDIPGQVGGAPDAARAAAADTVAGCGTRRENVMTLTDQPFFVSVRGETLAEVERYWSALSASGSTIDAPTDSALQ